LEDNMKIRVWAEYLDPKEAVKKKNLELLSRYNVNLAMAIPPERINKDHAKLFAACEQAGVETTAWVLLGDEAGYWACETNAVEFSAQCERVYDWADASGFSIPWLAVDVETPHYQMDRVKKSRNLELLKNLRGVYKQNRDMTRYHSSSRVFALLAEKMRARGVKTIAAASNFVVEDIIAGRVVIQDILETPISNINWDVISFMIYTSMLTGYSGGMLDRRDATWYLYATMRDMKEILWEQAGVSIGVTYIGKLEDEPYYSSPQELLPDMQAAKAALIDDVAVFNLEGILRSPRPEEWFEALMNCEPVVPERSAKVDAMRLAVRTGTALL